MNVQFLGNKELLKLKKTAFLASSTISSETVLKCYDWATEMRRHGECVISGFSSKLEQDVLHFLLKGTQLIIIVLARKMYKVIPAELQAPMEQNRLLIISVSNATRQSRTTSPGTSGDKSQRLPLKHLDQWQIFCLFTYLQHTVKASITYYCHTCNTDL